VKLSKSNAAEVIEVITKPEIKLGGWIRGPVLPCNLDAPASF
jgi:hypothetical protein